MSSTRISSDLAFLGAGPLSMLIARFDWSATTLGPIAAWPTTVRTVVGLALRSTTPIVLLWGGDGVMIYNDAYAVFAGGRHPRLLGSKVREGWPEVAEFNDRVMQAGLGGQSLTFTDQELTLYRAGAAEQVWMNLNYSPIPDEGGRPVGVMAVVVETTKQVEAERWLADERERLRQMFEQAPGFMAMLAGPTHVFQLTNAAYLQLIGHRDVIGRSVAEALPEVTSQGFIDLLDRVFATGEPFIGTSVGVELRRTKGAEAEQRFVDLIYQPVRDPDGRIVGIFVQGSDVTDRVLHEKAVRDSEAQFRLFAEAMPNHVWAAPADGQLDWFNSRVYEYSGAERGSLDGAGWTGMVHADDLADAGALWARSVAQGIPYETEFRLRDRQGNYRWHIARAAPLHDEHGRVTRWVGTNTDIDEQKRTAQELHDSEARLRLAIEAGQLAVWDLDLTTGVITPSPALNRLYGFAEDAQPSASDYQSRYAPGERERLAALAAAATARGENELEAEVRHVWPDGTEKFLLIRAQSVDEGKRAIGVVIDVTERRGVEQRLLASERRFRLSQNAAGIASLELDVASGMVMGSDTFWDLWGLTPRDSVHISVLEAIVLPEDGAVRSTEETRRAGTAVPNVEYRIRRPDTGELRWLARHIEFVHDEAGTPIKMFGIMQDVTEQKEAQERQRLLTHELEHRIKNILAMVSAIASQTLRHNDLDTARTAFNARLQALAAAHDMLTKTRWTQASVEEVVGNAIAPLPPAQVTLDGPTVSLPPKLALSLTLAVNELGTNSLKYGALASDSGQVRVDWSIEGSGDSATLVWTWTESGGPPVSAPTRRGFGRFLIERVLAADFGGTVQVDYAPQGLTCRLVAPAPGGAAAGGGLSV